MLSRWEAWGILKSHSCFSKFYCTSGSRSNQMNVELASKVDLMFSMKRHFVWLENTLSPISCLMCWFLAVKKCSCIARISHQSRAITELLLLAVRPTQAQLADLSVFAWLDRNMSYSHDAPALGCTSPGKLECISFKETVGNLFWQHILQSTLQSLPQAVFSVSLIFTLCIELILCLLSLAVL